MSRSSNRFSVPSLLAFVAVLSVQATSHAGKPRVAFDVLQTIPCRDVTPPDFATTHPGERIVEATLPVSMRVRSGDTDAVEEVSIEFNIETNDVHVVDFAPQTELVSHIEGQVERTTTTEQSDSLRASLGGSIPVPYGELVAQIAPSASASTSKQRVTTESSKQLPPMNAVVVSGTTDRGRGVFFKFRRTSRHTLEGVHTLSVQFAVPIDWRVGRANLRCQAMGHERILWIKKERDWTKMSLPIVLYEEGDARARAVAEQATGSVHLPTSEET